MCLKFVFTKILPMAMEITHIPVKMNETQTDFLQCLNFIAQTFIIQLQKHELLFENSHFLNTTTDAFKFCFFFEISHTHTQIFFL